MKQIIIVKDNRGELHVYLPFHYANIADCIPETGDKIIAKISPKFSPRAFNAVKIIKKLREVVEMGANVTTPDEKGANIIPLDDLDWLLSIVAEASYYSEE